MKPTRDYLGDGQMSEACEITRSGVLKMYSYVNSRHIRFAWRPRASNMAHLSKELAKII